MRFQSNKRHSNAYSTCIQEWVTAFVTLYAINLHCNNIQYIFGEARPQANTIYSCVVVIVVEPDPGLLATTFT